MGQPSASYGDFEEQRLKHLDLIQAVISRLAGNSFLVKGWAITLAAAFFGFALSSHSVRLAAVAFAPTLAFWGIDTDYLRSERLFRALYDQVRRRDPRIEPFFMGATGTTFVERVRSGDTTCEKYVASRLKTAVRPSLSVFYVALLAANGLFVWLAHAAA